MARKTSARKALNFRLATIGVMNMGIDAVIKTPFQGGSMRTTPAIRVTGREGRLMPGCAKGNTPAMNEVFEREEKDHITIIIMAMTKCTSSG
jgi:hypothetical protein